MRIHGNDKRLPLFRNPFLAVFCPVELTNQKYTVIWS